MGDSSIELGLTGREHGVVDSDTRILHDGEGRGHGHLQVGEESHGVAGRHLLVEHVLEQQKSGSAARTDLMGRGYGLGGKGLEVECALGLAGAGGRLLPALSDGSQVDPEPALREGIDIVAALLRTAQVAGQGGIRNDTVQHESAGAEGVPAPLRVGDQLGPLEVGENRGQGRLGLRQDLGEVDGDRAGAIRQ